MTASLNFSSIEDAYKGRRLHHYIKVCKGGGMGPPEVVSTRKTKFKKDKEM